MPSVGLNLRGSTENSEAIRKSDQPKNLKWSDEDNKQNKWSDEDDNQDFEAAIIRKSTFLGKPGNGVPGKSPVKSHNFINNVANDLENGDDNSDAIANGKSKSNTQKNVRNAIEHDMK